MTRAIAIALLLVALPVAAKPKPKPPMSPEKQAAAMLMNEGNEAFSKGDLAKAAERYAAAYERFPSPKILFNLAETQLALEHKGEAAELYSRFVQSGAADTAPDRLLRARQRIAELQAVVGQLRVTAMPPDSTVELDGKVVPSERIEHGVYVDPGAHELRAHDAGSVDVRRSVQVEAGKLASVELKPAPPPPAIVEKPPVVAIVEKPATPPPRPRSVWTSPAVIAPLTVTVALGAALIGTGAGTLVFHDHYTDVHRSQESRDFAQRTGQGLQWASEGLLAGTVLAAVTTTTIAVVLWRRNLRHR